MLARVSVSALSSCPSRGGGGTEVDKEGAAVAATGVTGPRQSSLDAPRDSGGGLQALITPRKL